jgi:hypothetical protein
MLRQIVINVIVTTAVSLLVSFLYGKYLRGCDRCVEAGGDPRHLERLQRRVEGGAGKSPPPPRAGRLSPSG